jgi:hypothetical protein
VLFFFFKPSGAGPCSLNVFLITTSLLLCSAFSALSLAPFSRNGSLFPSATTGLYIMYLCYSALQSEPRDYACNGLGHRLNAASGSTLVVGMLVTLLSVVYSALRAGVTGVGLGGVCVWVVWGGGNAFVMCLRGQLTPRAHTPPSRHTHRLQHQAVPAGRRIGRRRRV